MRVLVTGGLGVNGAWVVRTLVERGHEVVVFENRDDTSLVADVADRIELVVGDIRDGAQIIDAVTVHRPECVIHIAAVVDCNLAPDLGVAVNVAGTANVCAAAVAGGVRRVVFTSSGAVYGPAGGDRGHPDYAPITEDDPRRPWALYDITKAAAEDVLAWYDRTTDLECVSMRFALIIGPGKLQRHGGQAGMGKVITTYDSMIEHAVLGLPFELEQGGDESNGFVYVLDVADAVVTVALAEGPLPHRAYNVTVEEHPSIREFADTVRAVVPDAAITIGPGLNPMRSPFPYYMNLDGARMEKDFGWRPRFDLRTAVEHYCGVLRAAKG